MLTKRRKMLAVYWLPGIIGGTRLLLTALVLVWNPQGMPLRFFQIIPVVALVVALFSYFKLYSDGVPVITLLAPTILHIILVYLFRRAIVIIPFIAVFAIDIVFLVCKSVKASLYPFDIEGESPDDELNAVTDLLQSVE